MMGTSENNTGMDRKQRRKQQFEQGNYTGWFEEVYSEAAGEPDGVPWAKLKANEHVVTWLDDNSDIITGKRALVVGCGLGDDAAELARRGFDVTAIDVSNTAVEWCRRRFPDLAVSFRTADLLALDDSLIREFDFVVEAHTIQSLPVEIRGRAVANLAELVAVNGLLLVLTLARPVGVAPDDSLPQPVSRDELAVLETRGLTRLSFEAFTTTTGHRPGPRYLATYTRLPD